MAQFPPLTKLVKQLLTGIVSLWIAEMILQNFLAVPVAEQLQLTLPPGVHTLWQPFSFVFTRTLHPGGLIFVLVDLVFFGWMVSDFQRMYGKTRTLQLIAVSALAAAIPAIVVAAVLPSRMSLAGGGITVMATLVCFAWSRRRAGALNMFGAFRVEAMHLIYFVLGIAVLKFLLEPNPTILASDLGTLGGGIAFSEWMSRPPSRRGGIRRKKKKRKKGPSRSGGLRAIDGGKADDKPRWLN